MIHVVRGVPYTLCLVCCCFFFFLCFLFLMIRRPPRSTLDRSSAASDVYKRQGMKMVSDEFPAPVGPEFGRVVEEATFGVPLGDALSHLTDRFNSAALRFFVTSVMIQRESGGNLAEVIASISQMARKRFELAAKVRAVSAEGRLSALILFALPLALAGIFYMINAEYILILFQDPLGRTMVTVGGLLMVCGAAVTKRMVTVRI